LPKIANFGHFLPYFATFNDTQLEGYFPLSGVTR
jgi:hypothetical protein